MPKDMKGIMDEYSSGKLHSGSSSGPVVRNRKQALAIGLSEQRQMGKKDSLAKAFKKVGSGN